MTRNASVTEGPELREEVEDGAIDEIITEMKTSAYRRPDAGVRICVCIYDCLCLQYRNLPSLTFRINAREQFKREKREIGQIDENTSYSSARPWLK